jgi:hypothetical protein
MNSAHEELKNVLLTTEQNSKSEEDKLSVQRQSSENAVKATVPLMSKLNDSEKHRAKKMVVIAVEIDGETWFKQVNAMVPETAKIVRDSTGRFVGLPAVVGG